MLKVAALVLTLVLLLLRRFLKPPAKKAREVLPEESPTAKAQQDAEAEASKKFGPRD